MNFKVVIYKCGCKTLWLNGTKRIPKCVEHKSPQREIVLWCETCNKKIVTSPLGGQRKRCYDCAKLKNARENKITKRKKVEESLPTSAEGIREQQNRLIDVWFEACRDLENWGLPEEEHCETQRL